MIKIGVITTPYSLGRIKKIEPMIREQCELIFIPYRKISEIKELYEHYQPFCDGFVCSGELGYKILSKNTAHFSTPTFYLDIPEGDFYKHLFTISNANKDLNFSRVFIDFISEENGFMGLQKVLKEEEFPYTHDLEVLEDIYERTFEKHLTLWKQGKTDLSITRMSNVVSRLEESGIPHIFIFPSIESILEQMKQIINEVQLARLMDNQLAIGIITIEGQETMSDLDFKQILLHKALMEYNDQYKILSAIQKKHDCFEIITSYGELKELTNQFTQCSVLEYLNKTLSFNTYIGWGAGSSLYQAKTSAENANKEAQLHGISCAFVITDNQEIVGPLGEEHCIQIINTVEPQLEQLSEKLEISTLQIKKIMAVIAKNMTDELTADELAFHLKITLRQANRILNKLEEKGIAKISHKKQEKLRGRPKKVYKLNFL
ncbi:transcriptional regulator [Neobacillus sp. SAB-20_R2A]|uniref:transcriptional regulator n=1 Tax=Neobacillus sp. SAB-20_R2A TaxID=3120519 RepID=UPI003C6E7E56